MLQLSSQKFTKGLGTVASSQKTSLWTACQSAELWGCTELCRLRTRWISGLEIIGFSPSTIANRVWNNERAKKLVGGILKGGGNESHSKNATNNRCTILAGNFCLLPTCFQSQPLDTQVLVVRQVLQTLLMGRYSPTCFQRLVMVWVAQKNGCQLHYWRKCNTKILFCECVFFLFAFSGPLHIAKASSIAKEMRTARAACQEPMAKRLEQFDVQYIYI